MTKNVLRYTSMHMYAYMLVVRSVVHEQFWNSSKTATPWWQTHWHIETYFSKCFHRQIKLKHKENWFYAPRMHICQASCMIVVWLNAPCAKLKLEWSIVWIGSVDQLQQAYNHAN